MEPLIPPQTTSSKFKNYCYSNKICIGIILLIIGVAVVVPTAITLSKSSASTSESYDYIIIGGGPAGCIIASKLAISGFSVLLLEAGSPSQAVTGGDFTAFSTCETTSCSNFKSLTYFDIPYWSPWLAQVSRYKYGSFNGGKLLGGGGSINALSFFRGIKEDYELMINETGLTDWDWDSILTAYKAIENNTIDYLANDTTYHGHNGPIGVNHNDPFFTSNYVTLLTQTAMNAGYEYNNDFNGAKRHGVGPVQHNIKNGIRSTASADFLIPTSQQYSNLHIYLFATVSKILFNNNNNNENDKKTAIGVVYLNTTDSTQTLHYVYAKKEVIVSAGAINSPKILLQSGIGDDNYLQTTNIATVHHLPGVGKNLLDNHKISMRWNYIGNKTNVVGEFQLIRQYQLNQTGLLSCGPWFENLFFTTNTSTETRPNIQVVASDGSAGDSIYFLDAIHQYPQRQRTVTLRDSNPLSDPLLSTANYTDQDLDTLVSAIQMIREIVKYAPLNQSLGTEIAPGPTPEGVTETDYLRSWILQTGTGYAHFVGTTAMGNDTNPNAVLDSKFRVKGIQNLRVCDCGSLPSLVNGNTHYTALMIGERCADFILES